MRVRVLTTLLEDESMVSLRTIDVRELEHRTWLNKHTIWAWHHNRSVETWKADTTDDFARMESIMEEAPDLAEREIVPNVAGPAPAERLVQ